MIKPQLAGAVIATALVLVIAIAAWTASAGEPRTDTSTGPDPAPPAPPTEVDRTLQGRNVDEWHAIAGRYLHRVRSLQSALRASPTTSTAIDLACTVYRVSCSTLWRKARCESNLHRYSTNASSGAAGLFQFLPSTWRSTPFGRFSIYDPYANALAAGWMHERGRGGEWVCQ